jgi:hypothetical protein
MSEQEQFQEAWETVQAQRRAADEALERLWENRHSMTSEQLQAVISLFNAGTPLFGQLTELFSTPNIAPES